jgi:hypothetical protein
MAPGIEAIRQSHCAMEPSQRSENYFAAFPSSAFGNEQPGG